MKPKGSMSCSLALIVFLLTSVAVFVDCARFQIDFNRDTFVKDGEDFRYISGSFHYFRSVEEYWDDVLKKFRLAGLNAVQTYVDWSSHQPSPEEEFNFEGNLNLFKFLETAQKNGLLVILRTGPFIDAERDMGGLPAWLLWQKRGIGLRTRALDFAYFVSRWFDHLLPRLKPHLYENGGPIIMFQVENEYGSFGCDLEYKSFLRDLLRFHLGNETVLFTTDGNGPSYMKCGGIPDVYPTIDFGPEKPSEVNNSFKILRTFAPYGPLVNSEYYPGWLDHWGQPHQTREIAPILHTLDSMLSLGANVNIYMFYGGTSFGFGSGSNVDGDRFDPCPTSYDYDAPLNEARDPTLKYFAIKNVIAKYKKVPDENPVFSKKASYGEIKLRPMWHGLIGEFLDLFSPPVQSDLPLTFDDLKVASGFVLYSTKITFKTPDPSLLTVSTELRDRAYIYVDNVYLGALSRTEQIYSMPLLARPGQTLSILVENQGRPCYGSKLGEVKGLGQNVTLGKKRLIGWTMFPLDLSGPNLDKFSSSSTSGNFTLEIPTLQTRGFGLYAGNFTIPANSTTSALPLDTFVRLDGWTKGSVWINGFNLGRYWPVVGPQETLYLPGPLLKTSPEKNTIIVMELEEAPIGCAMQTSRNKCSINFTDRHVINLETPADLNSSNYHHGITSNSIYD